MFIYSFINKYIFYLFSEISQLKENGFSLPKPPFFQTTSDIYDLDLLIADVEISDSYRTQIGGGGIHFGTNPPVNRYRKFGELCI